MKHKIAFGIIPAFLLMTGCGVSNVTTSTGTHTTSTNSAVNKNTMSVSVQTNNTVSNTIAASTSTNNDNGYLYDSLNEVMFIQYTDNNGQLSGNFYEDYVDSNNQFRTYNSPITGQISGGNITIDVTNGGQTYSGSVSGEILSLAVPKSDGTVQNLKFKKGNLNQYNEDVGKVRVTANNEQVLQSEENAANQIERIQQAVTYYHSMSDNPNHYWPTWDGYATGTINTNQPKNGYAAEIDMNSSDKQGDTIGSYEEGLTTYGHPTSWSIQSPKIANEYFGVTDKGIVFMSYAPPNIASDDSETQANQGSTGDGGWTNTNVMVSILSGSQTGSPIKTVPLSQIQ